jgi:hypothetical protein
MQKVDTAWAIERRDGKEIRKTKFATATELFHAYAIESGSKGYSAFATVQVHFTDAIYDLLLVDYRKSIRGQFKGESIRDYLNADCLSLIRAMEDGLLNMVKGEIAKQTPYKEILKKYKSLITINMDMQLLAPQKLCPNKLSGTKHEQRLLAA